MITQDWRNVYRFYKQVVETLQLLRLRYIDGESWESVAEVMGMSEKWVREDLNFRAIRELERCAKKQSG